MATNNIITTSLPEYVEQNKLPLINKTVFGGRTIEMLTKQTGIKTKAKINYLDTDPVFQDGSGCGFNAQGTATLTQREIETGLIKVNMDFCPDTLLGKWAEYLVRIRATRDELPFEQYLVENISSHINEKMEKAVWQGDTASEDASLSRFDGFLKLANAESDTVKVSIATGASAFDAIKQMYMAIPEAILEKGVHIFVSPAIFRAFTQEMVEKNLYHYSGPQNEIPREFVYPGTDVRVVSTAGLTGTLKLYASTLDNMFYGCDLEDDKEEFKLWFSDDDDVFKLKVRWNAGVQVAFPDHVVLGTMAAAPVSPEAVTVAVSGPVEVVSKPEAATTSAAKPTEPAAASNDDASGKTEASGKTK